MGFPRIHHRLSMAIRLPGDTAPFCYCRLRCRAVGRRGAPFPWLRAGRRCCNDVYGRLSRSGRTLGCQRSTLEWDSPGPCRCFGTQQGSRRARSVPRRVSAARDSHDRDRRLRCGAVLLPLARRRSAMGSTTTTSVSSTITVQSTSWAFAQMFVVVPSESADSMDNDVNRYRTLYRAALSEGMRPAVNMRIGDVGYWWLLARPGTPIFDYLANWTSRSVARRA